MYKEYFGEFTDRYNNQAKELELAKRENRQLRNKVREYERSRERSKEKPSESIIKRIKSSNNVKG